MSNTDNHMSDSDDEISLADIFSFFAEQWKFILSLALFGAALGTGYSLLSKPRYQVSGQIQVGKVANVEVETPAMLMAKLAMPSYFSSETFQFCEVSGYADPGELLLKKVNAALNKTAPIVTITLKTTAPNLVNQCIESILKDIRNNQNENASAMLKVKKNQVQGLRQKLELAENLTDSLFKASHGKSPQFDFGDQKFSAATLLFVKSSDMQKEVRELRTQINELEFLLEAPQTKEADLVAPIYVSSVPVGPSSPVIVLLGGLVGGVLAVIYLLALNILRRSRVGAVPIA